MKKVFSIDYELQMLTLYLIADKQYFLPKIENEILILLFWVRGIL